jgi:hypothetical protein
MLGAGNQGHLRCSVYKLITPLKKRKKKTNFKMQRKIAKGKSKLLINYIILRMDVFNTTIYSFRE